MIYLRSVRDLAVVLADAAAVWLTTIGRDVK